MAYASAADIADIYGEDFLLLIAQRGGEDSLAGPLTGAAIEDACAQASSEADSYIAGRFSVPVEPAPRVLQLHVINMACHHLASTADRMTEQIRQRYEDALKWLHDVAAGRASPGPGETQNGHGGQSGNPDEAMVASRPAVNWRQYP